MTFTETVECKLISLISEILSCYLFPPSLPFSFSFAIRMQTSSTQSLVFWMEVMWNRMLSVFRDVLYFSLLHIVDELVSNRLRREA